MTWKSKESKKLIEAILTLETGKEAADFLCDLMTEKEIIEFSKRFQAAEMLGDKVKYTTIEEKTGLSSTTIARVAKCLNASDVGYRNIINKLHHKNSIQVRRGLSL